MITGSQSPLNGGMGICDCCAKAEILVRRLVTVARPRGGVWYIFDQVPAWVCPNCGHRLFDAGVLDAMETRMTAPPADARPVEAWGITLSGS